MISPAVGIADRVCEILKSSGVSIVASLPDSWLSEVIEKVDTDPAIRHVRVAREDDAIGICAGAYLGGSRAAVICQNAGVLASVNALAGLAHHHRIPVLILAAHRGDHDDRFYYQAYKGRVTEGVLDAIAVPYHRVRDDQHLDLISDATEQATLNRSPVVLLFSRSALQGVESPDRRSQ